MKNIINPQLLSPEELHEAHLEMAKEYLKTKWSSSIYKLVPVQYDCDSYENYEVVQNHNAPYYGELTDEQFSRIDKLMKEAGETPWYEALSDDSELLEKIISDYGEFPESISSDTPLQVCNCMVGVLEPTGQMNTFPYDLLLTKEEYLKLLVIVMDHREVTFNDLYKFDNDLFKKISEELTSEARNHSERNKKQSYTLVFSEIEEDVSNLLGEEDEKVQLYSETLAYYYTVTVFFSENKMSVVLTEVPEDSERFIVKNEIMYNIDANAILRNLKVDSYHEAAIILKNRYACYAAFYLVKQFLDENKIGYKYTRNVD